MNKIFSIIFLLALISGCGQDKSSAGGNTDYVVTIKTSYGDMVAILYDETPKHKENFIKLAKEKFFDSTLFHRVIPGFMLQGGDPESRNAKPGQNLGSGGPGYTIPAEINPNFFHVKGALSAARLGDNMNPQKESSGSQFYIVQGTVLRDVDIDGLKYDQAKLMAGLGQMYQSQQYTTLFDSLNQLYSSGDMKAYQTKLFECAPRVEKNTGMKVMRNVSPERVSVYKTVGGSPHLDGEYTVFGKVIRGLEIIDKITAVSRDGADRPHEDIKMTVSVVEMPKEKITKEYGWKYQ